MSTGENILSDYRYKTGTNRIGLWLFLVSDMFVFGGLLIARYVLWGDHRPELNQLLGLVVTLVLMVSSFFMNRAESAMVVGDMKEFRRGMLITIALGLLFLLGVVGLEWPSAPFKVDESAFSAVFFMVTGMHALHVLSGVVFLLIVFNNSRKGLYYSREALASGSGSCVLALR